MSVLQSLAVPDHTRGKVPRWRQPTLADEQLVALAAPLLRAAGGVLFDLTRGSLPRLVRGSQDDLGSAGERLLRSLCWTTLESEWPLRVTDARAERRFQAWPGAGGPEVQAFLGVTLRGARGRVLGVLAVFETQPRVWTPEEEGRLLALGQGITGTLERAELIAENERLSKLALDNDARHRRLVESCPLPIYSLDRDGRVTEANSAAAELAGRHLEDLRGSTLADLIAPEDLDFVRAAFAETLAGNPAGGDLECRIARPSGERRILRITRAPIRYADEVVGVQGIARDITEERAHEARFRRAERLAGIAPLLRGVCHELNNPLTSIKSFADLLLLDERPEEEREALEIVAREAARAARIVTDLRLVARQRQEAAVHRSLVDLPAIIERVLADRATLLAGAGVTVRLDLDRQAAPAWAVRDQIEQVLLHLLTNSAQALRDRPHPRIVTIATFPGELGVVLQVSDTGPGIAPENLNRIFDPFWTTKAPGEGTGLGLSLVQSIVDDHGGRISVDSRLERGASFTIDFPAAHRAPLLLETATSEQKARRSLRILVLEQDAPLRASVARYLELRGHFVARAADCRGGFSLLGESTNAPPFDILVADLHLPDCDGERLATRLRDRPDGLERRLVFLTADRPDARLERFLRDLGVPIMEKPFELAEVAQIIEAHAGMFDS